MFREDKTTQMAAQFLSRSGGSMPQILLMTMLYTADREMLMRHGIPITYDHWMSTKRGPLLRATQNLISADGDPPSYWSEHIRADGEGLVLWSDPGDEDLSRAEDRLIEQTYSELVGKDQWEAVDIKRRFPERVEPGESSEPITHRQVLEASGLSAQDTADILENMGMVSEEEHNRIHDSSVEVERLVYAAFGIQKGR